MSPAERRYLLLEQGLGAGIVNAALNAGIAWLSFRGTATIPFWGQQSIAGDTIGTCFLLPLITALIATPLSRGRIRSGALAPVEPTPALARVLAFLPAGTSSRGLAYGILTTVLVAPPTLVALRLFGVDAWSFRAFVEYKAIFGGVLGAAVTPLVALLAMASSGAWGGGGSNCEPADYERG